MTLWSETYLALQSVTPRPRNGMTGATAGAQGISLRVQQNTALLRVAEEPVGNSRPNGWVTPPSPPGKKFNNEPIDAIYLL
jgi:hypothetical protein